MTATELERLAGRTCSLELQIGAYAVCVDVEVLDARTAYGREDVYVRPIAGEGSAWVSSDRVKVKVGKES